MLEKRRFYLLGVICLFLASMLPAQQFFPAGAFHPDNLQLDSFVSRWYSEQLSALQEPSLLQENDSNIQVYRFLWLRTFHHPLAVRVTIHPDGSRTVTTKMADGAGGYKPGKLILNRTSPLTSEQAKHLADRMHRLLFGTIPLRDTNHTGRDGAQWILEGMDNGRYRVMERWSPEGGAVRELGLYFIRDLGRLKIKADKIY